jgi:predicted nucleotidyltransferase
MDRDIVIKKINTNLDFLKDEYGVEHLFLFGSVARNSAGTNSDIDLLVEFARPTGLFGLLSLQLYLEQLLGRSVDLGTFDSLKSYIKPEVEREMLLVA